MRTHNAPWDYKPKRSLIKSRLVRICADCGGNTYLPPFRKTRTCLNCRGTHAVEVWEHELDAERAEIEKARQLVADLEPQAAELYRGLTAISYLNGDEPAVRW